MAKRGLAGERWSLPSLSLPSTVKPEPGSRSCFQTAHDMWTSSVSCVACIPIRLRTRRQSFSCIQVQPMHLDSSFDGCLVTVWLGHRQSGLARLYHHQSTTKLWRRRVNYGSAFYLPTIKGHASPTKATCRTCKPHPIHACNASNSISFNRSTNSSSKFRAHLMNSMASFSRTNWRFTMQGSA